MNAEKVIVNNIISIQKRVTNNVYYFKDFIPKCFLDIITDKSLILNKYSIILDCIDDMNIQVGVLNTITLLNCKHIVIKTGKVNSLVIIKSHNVFIVPTKFIYNIELGYSSYVYLNTNRFIRCIIVSSVYIYHNNCLIIVNPFTYKIIINKDVLIYTLEDLEQRL